MDASIVPHRPTKIYEKLERFWRFSGQLQATKNEPEFYQFWGWLGSSPRGNFGDCKWLFGNDL